MFGKFHDADYDGIVLKIPNWFIEMNGINPLIETIHTELKRCEKSVFHPDYTANIYELENRVAKKEMTLENKNAIAASILKKESYNKKLANGEIYELVWQSRKEPLDCEDITIKNVNYRWSDYMTEKLNIKTSFSKLADKLLCDFDSIKEFSLRNCAMLSHHCEYSNQTLIKPNIHFYCHSSAGIGISYDMLYIKVYENGKKDKNKLYYRTFPLIIIDGVYAIDRGGNLSDKERLEGFEIKNMMLVKP